MDGYLTTTLPRMLSLEDVYLSPMDSVFLKGTSQLLLDLISQDLTEYNSNMYECVLFDNYVVVLYKIILFIISTLYTLQMPFHIHIN